MTRDALRLGIDLDGVVADFNGGWMRRYNDTYGTALEPSLVRHWDDLHTHTHFPDQRAFWHWAATEGNGQGSFFRHLDPYPGALDALRRLDDAGHSVVILTSKPDWAVHDTFAWVAAHEIPTREVHVVSDKASVTCDVYLDDADHNLVRLRAKRPGAVICRYVQPWNDPADGLHDIPDWGTFLTLIDHLERRERP